MALFDNPLNAGKRFGRGCACGRHASDAEHAADIRAEAASVEASGEEGRYRRVVEQAVMRALFPNDVHRRAFLTTVGASTAAAALFGLTPSEEKMLNEVPYRGTGTPMPPTDPLIYRFYEMVMVNGPAWKALIEEEFGDGIMSAIDFEFERLPNPKGDRVKITMSGKFLPYKYYGNEQGIPDYGFKEG